MKKRNLFISLLFAFLMCFTLNFTLTNKSAFAESETITITFNASGGTCDPTSQTIESGQTVTLPTPTYAGYIFTGWYNEDTLVDGTETYTADTELVANYVRKIYKYTITKNVDIFEVEGQTQSSSIPYSLEDSDSLASAIDLINEDLVTRTDETIILIFDDIELTENLALSYDKLELSGSVSLGEYSINITPTANGSKLYLTDLELASTSNQNLVNILGSKDSELTVSNTSFTSSQKDNNYSLFLESPIHSLRFINTLSYSSEYLYNYELAPGNPDFQKKALFDTSFVLEDATKIAITIPYNVDNQSILTARVGTESLFEVFPNASNFTCSVKSKNANYLVVSTSFEIEFDSNGGTIIEPFTNTSTNFGVFTELMFPTETNYSKPHQSLDGFVAKFTYDGDTWYFDKTALSAYLSDNREVTLEEKFLTNFYSAIPNTALECFTYYKCDKSATDLNFIAADLILQLGSTPSYVAIWSDTEYQIILNENGGDDISDISGHFESAVTLPTPTRDGYNFVGWFESLDKANTANPAEKLTITTMPDTNPTLYAGWSVITHTFTIHKNNQSSNIQLTIDFGTLISSISETDSQTISKKGYTFVGWFTDAGLTTPLEEDATMPDSDFDIYASWSINQYTITLYYNHPSVEATEIFKTTTQDYNSDVRSMFTSSPIFEGYSFRIWCKDANGKIPDRNIPQTMPDNDLTLYASWTIDEYTLTIIHTVIGETKTKHLYFGDDLSLLQPEYSGLIFGGWFADEDLTEVLDIQTMPSRNLTVYAKFIEKDSLNPTLDAQSYSESSKDGYKLPSNLEGFLIEYFVDEAWTTTAPTKKGSYDVRISKAEDNFYKSFVKTIENGYTISADPVDLSVWIVIFYCLAGIEIICSIIILLLIKQRKTYLTYAITLPIGLVQTSQFINFIVSLVLAVFGFVLLVLQFVKLKKVNNQISNISTENEGYKPPDISENTSISKNVEILLEKEGFISANKEPVKTEEIEEDDIFTQEKEDLDETSESIDDDYLSLDSKKDDDSNF